MQSPAAALEFTSPYFSFLSMSDHWRAFLDNPTKRTVIASTGTQQHGSPPGRSILMQHITSNDDTADTYVRKRNRRQDKLPRVCQAVNCGMEAKGRAAARARTALCQRCALKSEIRLRTNPEKLQRFCQACRNVHGIEFFQGKKASCEAALQRNRIARRRRRGKYPQKERYDACAHTSRPLLNQEGGSKAPIYGNSLPQAILQGSTAQPALTSECKPQHEIQASAGAHAQPITISHYGHHCLPQYQNYASDAPFAPSNTAKAYSCTANELQSDTQMYSTSAANATGCKPDNPVEYHPISALETHFPEQQLDEKLFEPPPFAAPEKEWIS